jgi:type IX secretion system PorP/SprF family membrane protein
MNDAKIHDGPILVVGISKVTKYLRKYVQIDRQNCVIPLNLPSEIINEHFFNKKRNKNPFKTHISKTETMKHLLATLTLILVIQAFTYGQDKHFTQFYSSPLTLNPALTGAFDGRYRVSGIYRDQWRNVLDEPYRTFSGAIDVRFDLAMNSRYKDAIAAGIMFFSDQVGVIDFNTNQMALSAAFHKGLDWDKKQFLTIGIQGSLSQRNVNYESLTFNDQFKSEEGFINPTGEVLPPNNFSFSDLA